MQIERLHLESLLTQNSTTNQDNKRNEKEMDQINLQTQLLDSLTNDLANEEVRHNEPGLSTDHVQSTINSNLLDEGDYCNKQQLDLNVNEFIFGKCIHL